MEYCALDDALLGNGETVLPPRIGHSSVAVLISVKFTLRRDASIKETDMLS